MSMARHTLRPGPKQRGLTLVEVLIALVIGMLTVLVVVNLMSSYSAKQRSARAVDDAQMNALLGLHVMEQDLRMAGHGLSNNELQNCSTLYSYFGSATGTAAAPVADFATAAVSVVDGGSGTDTVIVRFAESVRGIRPANLTNNMSAPTDNLVVDTGFGFRQNDLVLVSDSLGRCALRQITASVPTGAPFTLTAASSGSATYNPPSGVATGTPTWPSFLGANSSVRVFALGGLTIRRYSVNAQGLAVRNINAGTDTPVAADIVDLQAQYGISASAASTAITQWVSAAGGWASPGLADRKRIRAVRLALVARSAERAATDVSPTSLELWPEATSGQTSAAQSYTVPDRRFRYRVLRTVIPMKNLLWAELA
jgi:type IV pilus assembly protein PilW